MRNLKRTSMWTLLIFGTTSLTAAAQFGQNEQSQSQGQAQQQQQQPRRQAPQKTVVAKVNGDTITRQELETRIESRLRGQQPEPQQRKQLEQEVLNEMVESRLVEQYVLEEGPGADRQEVQQVMQRFQQRLKQQGLSLEEFLATRGQTKEDFRKRIAGSIAWNKFQEQELTPDKLREYYEENQQQFGEADFQQAQQKVAEAYTAELWDGIVDEMKQQPDTEIEIVKPQGQSGQKPNRPRKLPQQNR